MRVFGLLKMNVSQSGRKKTDQYQEKKMGRINKKKKNFTKKELAPSPAPEERSLIIHQLAYNNNIITDYRQ